KPRLVKSSRPATRNRAPPARIAAAALFGYRDLGSILSRGVGRSVRILGMRHDLLQSLARFAVAVAIVATAASCVVPLLAVATGAYAFSPSGVAATLRLLVLFVPQAVAVALPIASATAVLFVCRNVPVTRQVCITVGAFTVATALVTAALNVS